MDDIKQRLLADVKCDCERCALFKQAADRIEQLELECKTLAHGKRLADNKIYELENTNELLAQKLFTAFRFMDEEQKDQLHAAWEAFVKSLRENKVPEVAS